MLALIVDGSQGTAHVAQEDDILFLILPIASLFLLSLAVHLTTVKSHNGVLERNEAVGIRTKATKTSDRSWQAAHKAARSDFKRGYRSGYLFTFFVAGALLVINVFNVSGSIYPLMPILLIAGYALTLTFMAIGYVKSQKAAKKATYDESTVRND